jgi:hypothetical protein
VTHGKIQTAIALGITEVTGGSYGSDLSVMDHEAGISIRSPRRINDLWKLVNRNDSSDANRLLLSIHHESEAIRSAHFARQHHATIDVPPIPAIVELTEHGKEPSEPIRPSNLALTKAGRILHVADLSAYLGCANNAELTEIKHEYVQMLRERYETSSAPSGTGEGSIGVLRRTIAQSIDERRALLEEAMIKVFTERPTFKRLSKHVIGDISRTMLIPAITSGAVNEVSHTGVLGAGVTTGGVVVLVGKSCVSRMNPNGKHYALLRLKALQKLRVVGAALRRPPTARVVS